ncbi:hypothetical protein TSOC_001945 [Tetrabaena socialis]|uniref:Uncharacterized protein n=1 Tax=Tetrabaena socialis TaxID=47790 RepID=A0A2J8AFF7_9CHLO|nr:hypothetical protein TSOC_001945 [Tetrabaena socialis]|eukprot:PNH11222.1 hypothetical protein TSOC_001945 [Tetrabaena socialis]
MKAGALMDPGRIEAATSALAGFRARGITGGAAAACASGQVPATSAVFLVTDAGRAVVATRWARSFVAAGDCLARRAASTTSRCGQAAARPNGGP